MILKEMTKHECRRNDELGSAGAPARCVTRLAGHSSGGFRRGRRKERARRPRSPGLSFVIDSSLVIRYFHGQHSSHSFVFRRWSDRFFLLIGRSFWGFGLHRYDDAVWRRTDCYSIHGACAYHFARIHWHFRILAGWLFLLV